MAVTGKELITLGQIKLFKNQMVKLITDVGKKDSIIHIASNSNLDDFVTPGRYDIDKASSEYVITNRPSDEKCIIDVLHTDDNTAIQYASTSSNTYAEYCRTKTVSDGTETWSQWHRLVVENVDASGKQVIIGSGATNNIKTSEQPVIAIGANSVAGYADVAIGDNAQATGNQTSVAIGSHASATSAYDVAIGDAKASDLHAVAIGEATSNGNYAISINGNATASLSTSLGYSSTASGNSSVAIGMGSSATGQNDIAIGQAGASGGFSTAIGGTGTMAEGYQSIAINGNVDSSSSNGISFGVSSSVQESNDGVAVGTGATVSNAPNSVALGRASYCDTENTVSVGTPDGSTPLYRRIVNVDDPINAHDVTTKAYVDNHIPSIATSSKAGVVKPGAGLTITDDGTLNAEISTEYTLSPATSTKLGGVKIGSGISVASDGTISAVGGGSGTLTRQDITISNVTSSIAAVDLSGLQIVRYNDALCFYGKIRFTPTSDATYSGTQLCEFSVSPGIGSSNDVYTAGAFSFPSLFADTASVLFTFNDISRGFILLASNKKFNANQQYTVEVSCFKLYH